MPSEQDGRDLVRARRMSAGTGCRRDIGCPNCCCAGIVYYQGKAWTGAHDRWLRSQSFSLPGLRLAYDIAYDTMLATGPS